MTDAERWEKLKGKHFPAKGKRARIRQAQQALNEAVIVYSLPAGTMRRIMEADEYDQ